MSLGKTLRNAREERGLSPTDVAEQTNMMVQIVEELENEDFHRIAAPIYGRGFLKLYADLLGIDPKPLIEEFMDISTGKIVPELRKRDLERPEVHEKTVRKSAPVQEIEPDPMQNIPQRAVIIPHQAVQSLNALPKPLQKTVLPEMPVVTVTEIEPDPEPEPEAEWLATEQAAPEVGKGLFDSDEPNLFNTTPLQERIASVRRRMDEGRDDEGEPEKKASLHLGSNKKLPIFQIGGRMDETYEAEPRRPRSRPKVKIPRNTFLSGIERFFAQLRDYLPFDLNGKIFYVYGLLGLIVVAFLAVGITALFKLTAPADQTAGASATVIERAVEKIPEPNNPGAEGKIPPPPDMYFD